MGLVPVRVAAERLGIAYSTLKRWVLLGRVRTTRTEGGHHRIAESEIDRLIAAHSVDGPSTPSRPSPTDTLVGLSARNRLRGFVQEVRVDGLLAQVRLRVGDQSLTAVITSDAVKELKLERGDEAVAVIKSTEVMVAREGPQTSTAAASAGTLRKRDGRKRTIRRATERSR
ncbi:MAG: TOBE domain-containing protein [Vicinamibacterales bacterium]